MQIPVHRFAAPIRRILAAAAFSAAAAIATTAQGAVLVVDDDPGPGVDFATIQEAVDFAADQDVIVVRAGSYDHFEIAGKALAVLGESGPKVGSSFLGSGIPAIQVTDLPASKAVTLRGLVLDSFLLLSPTTGVFLRDDLGPVLLEDMTIGTPIGIGLAILRCASVTVQRCSVSGAPDIDVYGGFYLPNEGIVATESDVYLYDSAVLGSPGGDAYPGNPIPQTPDIVPGAGGAGFRLRGGSLLATGSTIAGGVGGGDAPGLCFAGVDGGPGLVLEAFTTEPVARLLDTTTAGGQGGTVGEPTCGEGDGAPGPDRQVDAGSVEDLAGAARSFAWDSPVSGGDPFAVAYAGAPGDLVVLLIALGLGPDDYLDGYGAALLIDPFYVTATIGFLPASGSLTQTLTALDPGFLGSLELQAQAAFIDVGAQLFLSGPSNLTLLAASE